MRKVLVVYYSMTGITEKMAEYIGEGLRIAGHQADVKDTSKIKDREDVAGYDAYIFGSPTHHRDIATPMKNFLLVPRREDLQGKLGGAFGSFTHDGNAPAAILKTIEFVFRMVPTELGAFNILETIMERNEGLRACHDYGKAFGEELEHFNPAQPMR